MECLVDLNFEMSQQAELPGTPPAQPTCRLLKPAEREDMHSRSKVSAIAWVSSSAERVAGMAVI
jgi:hypothetical protein